MEVAGFREQSGTARGSGSGKSTRYSYSILPILAVRRVWLVLEDHAFQGRTLRTVPDRNAPAHLRRSCSSGAVPLLTQEALSRMDTNSPPERISFGVKNGSMDRSLWQWGSSRPYTITS